MCLPLSSLSVGFVRTEICVWFSSHVVNSAWHVAEAQMCEYVRYVASQTPTHMTRKTLDAQLPKTLSMLFLSSLRALATICGPSLRVYLWFTDTTPSFGHVDSLESQLPEGRDFFPPMA